MDIEPTEEFSLKYCDICKCQRQHRRVRFGKTFVNVCMECCESEFKYVIDEKDLLMLDTFMEKKLDIHFNMLEKVGITKIRMQIKYIFKLYSDKVTEILKIKG